MPICKCGCDGETAGGDFLPGHDQKLRADLERRVGGLAAMRSLVENAEAFVAGNLTPDDLVMAVDVLFAVASEHRKKD